jgi:hypothetical protein
MGRVSDAAEISVTIFITTGESREAPEHIQHYPCGGDGGCSRMFAPVLYF